MSLRTPLGRALGLGSARSGSGHWWAQRMTAVGLVPLALWFVFSVLNLDSMSYTAITVWIASPINATLLVLLVSVLIYHSKLGVQVVIEDYVHAPWLTLSSLITSSFLHIALAVGGIIAILKIAFGAGS